MKRYPRVAPCSHYGLDPKRWPICPICLQPQYPKRRHARERAA